MPTPLQPGIGFVFGVEPGIPSVSKHVKPLAHFMYVGGNSIEQPPRHLSQPVGGQSL